MLPIVLTLLAFGLSYVVMGMYCYATYRDTLYFRSRMKSLAIGLILQIVALVSTATFMSDKMSSSALGILVLWCGLLIVWGTAYSYEALWSSNRTWTEKVNRRIARRNGSMRSQY